MVRIDDHSPLDAVRAGAVAGDEAYDVAAAHFTEPAQERVTVAGERPVAGSAAAAPGVSIADDVVMWGGPALIDPQSSACCARAMSRSVVCA